MQTLSVNGYDIAYLDVGRAADNSPPLVLVHGTLGDFRTWNAVLGPLSKEHRVIALSLRRFFPEHWDGIGNDYLMAQHTGDVIGFIEKLNAGPVDLMGHSRGGHIGIPGGAGAAGPVAQGHSCRAGRRSRTRTAAGQSASRPRAAGAARSGRSRDGTKRRHRRRAGPVRRRDRR